MRHEQAALDPNGQPWKGADALQFMPGNRTRIHPSIAPYLAAYVFALRCRYDADARRTYRGHTGRARIIRKGQIEFAKLMVMACELLAREIMGTVPTPVVKELVEEMRAVYPDMGV